METFLEWLFYQADQFYSNAGGDSEPVVSLPVSITLTEITRLIPIGGGRPTVAAGQATMYYHPGTIEFIPQGIPPFKFSLEAILPPYFQSTGDQLSQSLLPDIESLTLKYGTRVNGWNVTAEVTGSLGPLNFPSWPDIPYTGQTSATVGAPDSSDNYYLILATSPLEVI